MPDHLSKLISVPFFLSMYGSVLPGHFFGQIALSPYPDWFSFVQETFRFVPEIFRNVPETLRNGTIMYMFRPPEYASLQKPAKANTFDKKSFHMDPYQETFQTWNKLADLYESKFMDLTIYDHTYDFICENVPARGARLLELGCGPGNVAKYLLGQRPDYEILGIDTAPNMVARAARNVPSAVFSVMDVRDISALDTKFDAIVGGFCLPYLNEVDAEKLMADCRLLLNEKGFLYLSFVEGDPKDSGFLTSPSGDRSFFNYHDLQTLNKLAIANDFELLKTMEVAYERPGKGPEMHTVFTAVKR